MPRGNPIVRSIGSTEPTQTSQSKEIAMSVATQTFGLPLSRTVRRGGTFATIGARVWARTICRGFVEDQEFGFVRDGCDEGVVIR